MDLTSFTNQKPKEEIKSEIIVDNNDVTITKIGEEVEFNFKNKSAIKKYQDFIFFSPTNCEVVDNTQDAQKFFRKSLEDGVEGLMFKSLTSGYKPGLRTGNMAKLKETKEDIDVVILGAEHGKGKRAGYYSSFLVAVKNDDEMCDEEDRFLAIGKVSSGIKEIADDGEGATMQNLTRLLEPLKLSEEKEMTYFTPQVVIQVRYQEIQKSPTYSSGYALRFPRIINLREDKLIDEINSVEDVGRFIS
jgi:DNA ligase-1